MKKINDDALRRAEAGERVLIERIEDISRFEPAMNNGIKLCDKQYLFEQPSIDC